MKHLLNICNINGPAVPGNYKQQETGMPTQIFRITRAPEAKEITAQEIKQALMEVRKDTEWDVKEGMRFPDPEDPAPGGSGQTTTREDGDGRHYNVYPNTLSELGTLLQGASEKK